ncbi:MAG: ATP-binding protein [Chthoniobacteraceae bacterium]
MTIRTKLTLWYAVVLLASLVLCSALLYQEWVVEPREYYRSQAKELLDPFDDIIENILYTIVPAAVLGLGGGWLLMRKVLAPLVALINAAEQLNEDNLDIKLPSSGNGDEIERLTDVFNHMTARLSESFQRIREFTLHASHELKTPLTIMRGSMEMAVSKEDIAEPYRELLLDQIEEVDRLAKIVDCLTLLTKADAGLVVLSREHINLETLVREIYADGQVLARSHNLVVNLLGCESIFVVGDNNRLRQMLLNVVDNAIKYNKPGGTVGLSLERMGSQAKITVTNTGTAIPIEARSRLFEPFFRVDASHARETEGCGLGLAIVQWIATAHGGTVAIDSRPDNVTAVTIFLPAPIDLVDAINSSQAS